ncbi:MAG: hypothetical protein IID44_30180 [Planctomycetes bacterium]|nr:hypothetical protein [Planctomycetota bacterium]
MVQTTILDAIADEKIKIYVVWTPVLLEDNRQAAIQAIGNVSDQRAVHFWDADKSLGNSLGKIVTLPRERKLAWDVYFAFDPQATWGDDPPQPATWMHQLGSDERKLDGARLRVAVEELLRGLE